MIDDLMDEPEHDEGPNEHDDRLADQRICHECNRETAGETCGFCGNDLCPMCFECGGGFCSDKHTQEQIDAYEDEVYPPANFNEACERKRQRQARNELQALGILPKP